MDWSASSPPVPAELGDVTVVGPLSISVWRLCRSDGDLLLEAGPGGHLEGTPRTPRGHPEEADTHSGDTLPLETWRNVTRMAQMGWKHSPVGAQRRPTRRSLAPGAAVRLTAAHGAIR